MHSISNSGKADSWGGGQEVHPYLKRVIDHLPAGRLLLAGETSGVHALYAAEIGWEVHAVGFNAQDKAQSLALAKQEEEKISFDIYEKGAPLCSGLQFDAAILLMVQLPPALRTHFHQAVTNCLKPDGGKLYLLAYSEQQPQNTHAQLPEIRYREADLVQDFKGLQIDLLQEKEEELPGSGEKVRLIHLTAVRNSQQEDSSDTVSFSLDG